MKDYLYTIVINILTIFFKVLNVFIKKNSNSILLIPHSGIYINDKSSINNWRSENCLSFLRYLLDSGEIKEYQIGLLSGDEAKIKEEENYIKSQYPQYYNNIKLYKYFSDRHGIFSKIQREFYKFSIISRFKYILSSLPHGIIYKTEKQKVIVLKYYSVPFKNDYFSPNDPTYMGLDKISRGIDYCMSNSKLASWIDSTSLHIQFDKFITNGYCRNDYYLDDIGDQIRTQICNKVNYTVKKILLYIPTHRDYEQTEIDVKRSVLGFEYNKVLMEDFLRNNNIMILCKLHPKQNSEIIMSELPKGIIIFNPSEDYGLTELMIISDGLLTDYTSGYFDYLLFNKPVIFNCYDYDKYNQVRGFSFDPLHPILAGEVITNEKEFYKVLDLLFVQGIDSHSDRRKNIYEIFNKFNCGSCKRTLDFIKSLN